MSADPSAKIPLIIAGPMLRRVTPDQIVLWLVCREPLVGEFEITAAQGQSRTVSIPLDSSNTTVLAVGRYAYVHLIDLEINPALPVADVLEYDLKVDTEAGRVGLASLMPDLLYPGAKRPSLVVKTDLDHFLHGSCRHPHHHCEDALVAADQLVSQHRDVPAERPALLMMSGDQIYADDVAGPMLYAIHRVIEVLGLNDEPLPSDTVADGKALYRHPHTYYQRQSLLPHTSDELGWLSKGRRLPVFTSNTCHNHLITLSEVLAMYLLVWSPEPWAWLDGRPQIPDQFRARYDREQAALLRFADSLRTVRRLFAHVPCYMIFDDHDITDDWNLTAQWAQSAYGDPLARRIIGNALVGYWICQGWGNAPDRFDQAWIDAVKQLFDKPSAQDQDRLIDRMLDFDQWHYRIPTQPPVQVLDTRTQRWWSERDPKRPSGLMDWEALSDLQQSLMDEPAVVLVSPAPMFGVKLIEAVQRVFTLLGRPLVVDAENWMAHPGSANTMLNIFRHPKTPRHFVILSGDVHYSFVYDIVIRFRKNSPHIWQITSSGIRNEFPRTLLTWLERLNQHLYRPNSPLNWFTKRRWMTVTPRKPSKNGTGDLCNLSGIGWVRLDAQGAPVEVIELTAGGEQVLFEARHKSREAGRQELRTLSDKLPKALTKEDA